MTWAFIPCTCSVGQAGESSPINYSDIALLAQSKSRNIPGKFCSHDSLTEAYLDSLFGTTCARSAQTTHQRQTTSSDFAELLATWPSAADFPAKTLAQLEKEMESPEKNQGSGPNSLASFARFDRDTCSWKTAQYSLLGDSEQFSETWPKWGLMLGGVCWELPTSAPSISANGSGLWPTPRTTGLDGGSNSRSAAKKRGFWPTAKAGDSRSSGAAGYSTASGRHTSTTLTDAVVRFPTPTTQDAHNNGGQSQQARNSKSLNAVAGGSLNPDWVEWLCGWPIYWTSLEPLKCTDAHTWMHEPADVPRTGTGVTARTHRLKAIGNGQVPQCAAAAWRILTQAE